MWDSVELRHEVIDEFLSLGLIDIEWQYATSDQFAFQRAKKAVYMAGRRKQFTDHPCPMCGLLVEVRNQGKGRQAVYCSPACLKKKHNTALTARRRSARTARVCLICKSPTASSRARYCSRKCNDKAYKARRAVKIEMCSGDQ